jgi:hypothetical protein
LFNSAVSYEPARGFGEKEDERSQDTGGDILDAKTDPPLLVVGLGKANV